MPDTAGIVANCLKMEQKTLEKGEFIRRKKELKLAQKQALKDDQHSPGSLSPAQEKFREKIRKEQSKNKALIRGIGNWWW